MQIAISLPIMMHRILVECLLHIVGLFDFYMMSIHHINRFGQEVENIHYSHSAFILGLVVRTVGLSADMR